MGEGVARPGVRRIRVAPRTLEANRDPTAHLRHRGFTDVHWDYRTRNATANPEQNPADKQRCERAASHHRWYTHHEATDYDHEHGCEDAWTPSESVSLRGWDGVWLSRCVGTWAAYNPRRNDGAQDAPNLHTTGKQLTRRI